MVRYRQIERFKPTPKTGQKGAPLLFAICAPCQPFTKVARKKLTKERKQGRERDRNLLIEATRFVARYKPE